MSLRGAKRRGNLKTNRLLHAACAELVECIRNDIHFSLKAKSKHTYKLELSV